MVSKHSAVRSIRLQNADWEWLSEEAARRETTVNGLVAEGVALVKLATVRRASGDAFTLAAEAEAGNRRRALDDLGFVGSGEQWPAGTVQAALKVSVPLIERKAFNPQPKKGTKK